MRDSGAGLQSDVIVLTTTFRCVALNRGRIMGCPWNDVLRLIVFDQADSLRMTSTPRWQLNRAGITNVYQYEHETLTFRDGRLLLRGINGSGKSTAMNMLLPFLLTGKTRGIDAAGEQTGVLKSWMLSGRDEKQPVGYLWVEFERAVIDGGDSEHLSIGCGIKANRASDTVVTWWFVTHQRPGIDFELLEAHVPLSVDSLRTVIAPDPVFAQDRRADYRREVARRLYGGADIDSFLDLINTVRSPRVGDRVDLELPQYLVSAMPNLSETALIEAARPLDDLDEHRRNVSDLGTTESALSAMVAVYRQYALTELCNELRSARELCGSFRRAREQARKAEEISAEASIAEARSRDQQALLEARSEELQQEIHALQGSSAYTDGQQLEDLRRHVQSLERRAADDHQSYTDKEQRQPALVAAVSGSERLSDERINRLSDELSALVRQGRETGVKAVMPSVTLQRRRALPDVDANEPLDAFDVVDVCAKLKAASGVAATRTADVEAVRQQLVLVDAAHVALRDAQSAQALASEALADSQTRFDEGRQALDASRHSWADSVNAWMPRARQSIATVSSAPSTPVVTSGFLETHTEVSIADLHRQRRQLEVELNQALDIQQGVVVRAESLARDKALALDEAQQILDELNARTEPEVPVLNWQKRTGPCLADVVDFNASLDEAARAGLEASLEASGLLMATFAEGGVRLHSGELLLIKAGAVTHPLSEFLTISLPDRLSAGLTEQQVRGVLDSISTRFESGSASVVTTEGQFRLGVLSGRHAKANAEFVGVNARRMQLERLRKDAAAQVDILQLALAEALEKLEVARQLAQELRTIRDELPLLTAVDQAQAVAIALEDELDKARERLAQRDSLVVDAEARLSVADDECQRICRNLELPHHAAGIDKVERVLQAMLAQLSTAVRQAESVAEAGRDWSLAVDRWRTEQLDLRKAHAVWQESRQECKEVSARLETLEATLGESYREVVERIGVSERVLKETRDSIPQARSQTEAAIRKASDARNKVENTAALVTQLELDCSDAHGRLTRVLNVPGLLAAVVLPESSVPSTATDGAPDSGIELPHTSADAKGLNALAMQVQSRLPEFTGSETRADGVRISLRQRRNALGAGWDAEDQQPDISLPMCITVTGPLGQMPLANSLTTVRTQLSQLQALLSEKQDQALRNLLQGLIAREVAERMFEAKRLIERMNARLQSVTSTHGIGVRLRWRRSAELDEATAQTVDILGKPPDLRSEEEEALLRDALAQALEEARRLEPDAPYRQLIAHVFDYRRWHEMSILLRRGDDAEKRLTRRTPLSEGEKKLVSYLPLFAAVAAACDALADVGGHEVPRFLLLDDAFAKVSEDNHASLFGLLVSLDLDFIATSERLWGTHATVPGLAITEVVRDTALGAILLENSIWDGKTLTLSTPVDSAADTWGQL